MRNVVWGAYAGSVVVGEDRACEITTERNELDAVSNLNIADRLLAAASSYEGRFLSWHPLEVPARTAALARSLN
jgi:uncharacterized membrane protein